MSYSENRLDSLNIRIISIVSYGNKLFFVNKFDIECTCNTVCHDGLCRLREKQQYVITRGLDINVEIMTII